MAEVGVGVEGLEPALGFLSISLWASLAALFMSTMTEDKSAAFFSCSSKQCSSSIDDSEIEIMC